jgi:hypothetical protein
MIVWRSPWQSWVAFNARSSRRGTGVCAPRDELDLRWDRWTFQVVLDRAGKAGNLLVLFIDWNQGITDSDVLACLADPLRTRPGWRSTMRQVLFLGGVVGLWILRVGNPVAVGVHSVAIMASV